MPELELERELDLAVPDRTWFAEVNRTRLRVWDWGDEGAPAIICVHGAFDHGRMWDGLAPRLAALGYRVVCPDLRGHGDSGRLGTGHIWLSTSLDIALLARELGGPVGLVGHSFGGGQALFVAAVWPELVRWVVNLDGLGPSPDQFAERDMVEAATNTMTALERVAGPARVYPSLDDMAERRGRVNVRLPKPWVDHLVRHGAVEIDGGWAWKSDPMFSVGLPGDFDLDHLHAEQEMVTDVPVLALTGREHDTWSDMTDEQVAERVTHLPTAVHHVIEDAGHYVHIERPDAVIAAIEAFVSGQQPR
jgi:pimeloyl-ACP methyl ester carboxylesterase